MLEHVAAEHDVEVLRGERKIHEVGLDHSEWGLQVDAYVTDVWRPIKVVRERQIRSALQQVDRVGQHARAIAQVQQQRSVALVCPAVGANTWGLRLVPPSMRGEGAKSTSAARTLDSPANVLQPTPSTRGMPSER